MHGFVTRMVERRMRRLALTTTIAMAVISTTAVAAGRLYGDKFDDAELAVAKAQGLLADARCGNAGEKASRECLKNLKRARDLLAKARETVKNAAASDGGP